MGGALGLMGGQGPNTYMSHGFILMSVINVADVHTGLVDPGEASTTDPSQDQPVQPAKQGGGPVEGKLWVGVFFCLLSFPELGYP